MNVNGYEHLKNSNPDQSIKLIDSYSKFTV